MMNFQPPNRPKRQPEDLRSWRWFGRDELRSFGHRSRAKQAGLDREDWDGKPVIGILNTWSDLNSCHIHFKIVAEQIKRGILQAGGLPMEVPVMSVGESFTKPTSMLYRNFLAMETEETLRSNPLDAAVLMGGCDKTTPALIMGALSMDIPVIFVPAGPMLRGNWHGEVLGSGTDAWKYWDEKRAGNLSDEAWCEVEDGIARSPGHCMTMGTASTMTSIAETLGFTLPGAASIPASDSNHMRMATQSGRLAVDLAWHDWKPSDFIDTRSFDNAIAVQMAIGGSTNAIVHLVAMAGRAGIRLPLSRFDEISRRTPFLADLRPAGNFLMEDFYYAGGLRALLKEMGDLLERECLMVNGATLGANVADAEVYNQKVIRTRENACAESGGTAILSGNLCPNGAVIKYAAMDPRFRKHSGPAIVFEDYPDLKARLDDPSLPFTPDSVMVLKNAGPRGAPGMPEWGMLPLPKQLLEKGVRELLRLSDARMSGTSYGACALHISPESSVGGPLAFVRDGDIISLDVEKRTLQLEISDEEMESRRAAWTPPAPYYSRGYGKLYLDHVTQAHEGCDFDFLHHNGQLTPEPAIF